VSAGLSSRLKGDSLGELARELASELAADWPGRRSISLSCGPSSWPARTSQAGHVNSKGRIPTGDHWSSLKSGPGGWIEKYVQPINLRGPVWRASCSLGFRSQLGELVAALAFHLRAAHLQPVAASCSQLQTVAGRPGRLQLGPTTTDCLDAPAELACHLIGPPTKRRGRPIGRPIGAYSIRGRAGLWPVGEIEFVRRPFGAPVQLACHKEPAGRPQAQAGRRETPTQRRPTHSQ